jgi:predicted P-loop ATPase
MSYLMDAAGNRRFWPVACGTVDRAWIRRERAQLFAEAVHRLNAGETWYDVADADAREQVSTRLVGDALSDSVRAYLESQSGDVTVAAYLEDSGVPRSQWSIALQRRVGMALRKAGWRLSVRWTPILNIRKK